jgi:Tfp pilus assembly protein PilO
MDRKLKNTLILLAILVAIIIGGSAFTFFYQEGKIEEKKEELESLNLNAYDTKELLAQLNDLNVEVAKLDSILDLRKFNIPVNLTQYDFYNFVVNISSLFSSKSFVNIEFREQLEDEHFRHYEYRLFGTATFNDLYKLIYAIEKSKGLKKIATSNMNNIVEVDEKGRPSYLVGYDMSVSVYFSDNDRYASTEFQENNIVPNRIYDVFFPLIRKEIPPNTDNLLDVQTAQLLALLPEGAFLSGNSDSTYVLNKGDKVYLGYVTEVDHKKNEVKFILNKGGIIEKVSLGIE